MGSLMSFCVLFLSLTIFFGISSGFLQQHSEKNFSIATKNSGEYATAKEGQSGPARKSRSIHLLFPPDGEQYTLPPAPMMQETTTTPKSTSRRPPKQLPHTKPNSSKNGHIQKPSYKDCNPNCGCSTQYIPFCASNNVTYRNKCQLNCAQQKCDSGIRRKFEGVCPKPYVHYKPQRKYRYTSYSVY